MALFLEMDDVQFKPRAYEKAAQAVESLDRPLHEIAAQQGAKGVDALPVIGMGIALRFVELLEAGRMRDLEDLGVGSSSWILGTSEKWHSVS